MFKHSGQITTGGSLQGIPSTMSMTNIGLSIQLLLFNLRHTSSNGDVVAVLNCKDKEQRKIGIYLDRYFTRYCRVSASSFAHEHWENSSLTAQVEGIYLNAVTWTSSDARNPNSVVDFMIVASPTKSRPVILKEALRFLGEKVIDDSFELMEPHGSVFLSLRRVSEGLGLRFETMGGESFGLALYRYYDKGRECSDVLLNLNQQSFDKIALSAFLRGRHHSKGELFRDRLSFTLPSAELIKVSIKRLPTINTEQEAYYKVEIFEMPTKPHLQRDS
jgi:hypothetical protein